jgi:RNA polymerase sigma-70 factor, ECF subfamily
VVGDHGNQAVATGRRRFRECLAFTGWRRAIATVWIIRGETDDEPDDAVYDRPAGDDGPLIELARLGDRDALESLLRAQYDRVYAVCRRLTGNDADASDATQDALIAIVRGLARFDGRSQFSTWVYRVAVNSSIDELRRRSRRASPGLDDVTEAHLTRVSAGVPVDPEGAAVRVDVDQALLRLPGEFRAPVVLRDMCGLDYAEIAEVLQIPPGTVRSRIARGRAALVGFLGHEGGEA